MNRFFTLLLFTASVFCCTSCSKTVLSDNTGDDYSIVNAGDALPDFSVQDSDGNTVSASSLKGNVSMIVFFNTECPDCQTELPVVNKVYESLSGKSGIKFIAISRAQTSESVASYWKEKGFTIPYSAQADRTVYNKFATQTIPRIYIADKNNIIRYLYNDENMPTAEQLVSNLTLF